MENKIDQLFKLKQNNILSIYFTAGYPKLSDTVLNIKSLQSNDVDLIEIGIPYSDPLADGPIIQAANQVAIDNGMTMALLFQQLENSKNEIIIPIVLMSYLNVILQFGIELFYKKCKEVNVSAVIIPDLPLEEYRSHHQKFANKYGIKNVFLITPNTSIERIKIIDAISSPFIYVVSSNSVTGNSLLDFTELEKFFSKLNALKLKNKTLIGFGINNSNKFKNACSLATGAIIGSAFIKCLQNKEPIPDFINSIIKPNTISL